jgi:hypothetical protein
LTLFVDPDAATFLPETGSLCLDFRPAFDLRLTYAPWASGPACHRWIGDRWEDHPGLPILLGASRRPHGDPVRLYVETFPPDVQAILRLFVEHELALTRLLRLGRAVVELAENAPNLMWLVVDAVVERRTPEAEARRVLALRRVDILAWVLSTDTTAEMFRLLNRYRLSRRESYERSLILRALKDPAMVRAFRHAAEVTPLRLGVASRQQSGMDVPAVRRAIVHGNPHGASYGTGIARDCLRVAGVLGMEHPEVAVARCRTIAELLRLHDRWSRRMYDRPREVRGPVAAFGVPESILDRLGDTIFPKAPVPGTATIQYVESVHDLLREGAEMQHCVGGYANDCISGSTAIYRILAPERATLELRLQGEHVTVRQLKLARNGAPNADTLNAVRTWLTAGSTDE